MPTYMVQAAYTSTAWGKLVQRPENRMEAMRPVIEKLGSVFVRIATENTSNSPTFLRVVTPSGKTGFVSVDSVAPIGNDQLCYVKEAGDWKIGGYVGAGDVP